MAFASDSTTAPARPLLPLPVLDRRTIGRDAWARARELAARFGGEIRAHLAEGMRQAWAAARGLLPAGSTAPTANDARALASKSVSESTASLLRFSAPLPSLAVASSRRRAIFGVGSLDAVRAPDPAFAAIHAFDRVVAEWDSAYAEFLGVMDALDPDGRHCWDDPQAVARTILGPIAGSTVAALDRLLRHLEALDARQEAAEARLLSTRAASEIGAAALRACVRRYAWRPFGWQGDEPRMLERLAA